MPLPTLTTMGISKIDALELDQAATTDHYRKSHPVFKVTLLNGEKMVLKAETRGSRGMVSDHSARWAGKLMYQVSDYTKVNLLTLPEVQALKLVPQHNFGPENRSIVARTYLVDLLNARGFGFYKMPFVENIRNAKSLVEKGRGLELLAKMRDDRTVLFNLAKIVAVDLFVGNTDRFTETGEIGNQSNILFQENGTFTPIGVDFYFFESEASNLFTDPPDRWIGLQLQSPQTIRLYAERMVNALNRFFRANLGDQVQENQLLRVLAIGTVANGMTAGAQELKSYLQNRQRTKRIPAGVMKRMVLLRWA